MNKNFRFISLVLSFVFAFSAIAFGQETTGSIEGTVKDSNGAVVPGASVTVKSTGSTAGYNATVTANDDGFYSFPRLLPGTYTVSVAEIKGFKGTSSNASVSLGKASVIDFALTAGAGTTIVDVTTDSATQIDPGSTKLDNNISKQVFDALPKGTNFSSLLKTVPNVRPEALSGGFQVDGASGSENVFVIDGQEVTNFRTGILTSNNNLPFELLQEVQVKSTGIEAEYGGAQGGVVNVVTAGGNDNWGGALANSWRPGSIQGNPRPVINRFSSAVPIEYFNPVKDRGTNFFPVAALRGPILKGKLWFSAVYAPQFFNYDASVDYFTTGSNPTGRAVAQTVNYKASTRQEYGFVRLDAQPTSKLRLFGSFLWNPQIQKGLLPNGVNPNTNLANPITDGLNGAPQQATFAGVGTLSGAAFLAQQGGRQNANSVNTQATWNPTNWLIINGRFGRSFLNEKLNSYGLPQETRFVCSTTNGGAASFAGSGCSSGFQNFANNFQVNYDVSTRTTVDADATFLFNAAGRHSLKAGYQFNRLFNSVDNGYKPFGIVTLFYGVSIDNQIDATPTAGNLGSGRLQRFGTIGKASSNNTALFVQDSWQVAKRLTFNVGLRVENETVPNFGATGTQAIKFGWGDKISPRFGVAYDLTGDGKTKVFANYGWFYDRFKYELPRGSFGGDFFRRDYFEILPGRGATYTNYNFNSILGGRTDVLGGTCPITPAVGFSVCQLDFRIATNIAGADIFQSGAVDPNLKAARQSEYTIGVERELAQNFVVRGRFTHKQVDRAIEDVGVFTPQGSEAYIIGNPGLGLACSVAKDAGYPCARAERKYDAVEVSFDKRSKDYFFNASYTWSRLFGNYSGLASSDENGRTSPGVNRFFDLPPLGFNSNGQPDNGRLATDRPHVFKAFGGYSFNWFGSAVNRTTVSAFTTFQSGTPLTTIYDLYGLGTTILFGRGDLGRTEKFSETDLSISHDYKFGRDSRFKLQPYVDFRNVFDQKNELTRQNSIATTTFSGGTALSTSGVNIGNPTSNLRLGGCTACTGEGATFARVFNGGIQQFVLNYINNNNVGTLVTPVGATPGSLVQTPVGSRVRNDYNLTNGFQAPRDVRFGVRFIF